MAESLQTRKSPRLTLDEEDDNIDRLSSLPECIRLQLLSLLDLKEAAATSVLSTNWRDLFLQLPDIHLTFCVNGNCSHHDAPLFHRFRWMVNRVFQQPGIRSTLSVNGDGSEHNALFHSFTLFANRVLQQRNQADRIASLKLWVEYFNESFRPDLNSLLMSTAAAISTYKVKELHFSLWDCARTQPCSLAIPPAIFSSETLAGLHLNICTGWNVPEFVWLPKLRYVHLISFRLMDENSIQRLLNGCPMLENLVMRFARESKSRVETLSLSSSYLKLLTIGWDVDRGSVLNVVVSSESLEKLTFWPSGGHKINVDAPNLKYLSIRGKVLEVNIIRSFVAIEEAVIDADYLFQLFDLDEISEKASILFGALRDIQLLSLSENSLQALSCVPVMPTFKNLYNLKLTPRYLHHDSLSRSWISQLLLNLFENSPNLEVISFNKVFHNYFGENVQFVNVFPNTFMERIKEIEMHNFRSIELEYNLVKFFLSKGQSLKNLTIRSNKWRPCQCEKILSFKRYSGDCEIIFEKKLDFIRSA